MVRIGLNVDAGAVASDEAAITQAQAAHARAAVGADIAALSAVRRIRIQVGAGGRMRERTKRGAWRAIAAHTMVARRARACGEAGAAVVRVASEVGARTWLVAVLARAVVTASWTLTRPAGARHAFRAPVIAPAAMFGIGSRIETYLVIARIVAERFPRPAITDSLVRACGACRTLAGWTRADSAATVRLTAREGTVALGRAAHAAVRGNVAGGAQRHAIHAGLPAHAAEAGQIARLAGRSEPALPAAASSTRESIAEARRHALRDAVAVDLAVRGVSSIAVAARSGTDPATTVAPAIAHTGIGRRAL